MTKLKFDDIINQRKEMHKKMKKQENIILIGFMGCGKTSVGMRIAKKWDYNFLDTDQIIETEYGASISAIFQKEGEKQFRMMETAVLKRLYDTIEKTVIATGGGLPLEKENAALLKKIGKVFYLKTNRETTLVRLEGDTTRPLLAREDKAEQIDKMLRERIPKYETVADKIILADSRSFEDIIDEIEQYLKQ